MYQYPTMIYETTEQFFVLVTIILKYTQAIMCGIIALNKGKCFRDSTSYLL